MQAAALTATAVAAKRGFMTRTYILPLLAAAALSACDYKGETIVAGPGGIEQPSDANAAAADVKLPPSIVGSGKYRCKDNSVVSIDWLSDGTVNSARVTPEGGSATTVEQAEAGGAYTAEGASLSGDAKAQSVTYNGKSCKR